MKNILIIEDDINLNNIIAELLRRNHYTVKQTYDGIEGLKALKKQQFNNIILDIVMPELDGAGVLNEIRRLSIKPKIILISGHSQWMPLCKKLGADHCLPKPLDYEKLLHILNL